MKNIRNYTPIKYNGDGYKKVEDDIYVTFYDSNTFFAISDEVLINTLKDLDGWVENKKFKEKRIQYNGKEYKMKKNPFNGDMMIMTKKDPEEVYVTSLVFEPEPELGENEPTDKYISQFPIEDVLDEFNCWCYDFYEKENSSDKNNSYREFASDNIDNIRNLKTIVGKHVYNKEEDGKVKLIIE